MTLDTTQILVIALVLVLVLDAIGDKILVWKLIGIFAGGQRAPTFPVPPVPPVPVPLPGPVPVPTPVPVPIPVPEPPRPVPAPAPAPVPIPAPVGHSKVLRGKCSWFGGPNDKGVKPDEGLALVERSEFGHGTFGGGLFLPTQPAGTTGLARALNPDAHYIACWWDYGETSRQYLQGIKVVVKNPKTGQAAADVRPIDKGPNPNTGRVADLSPGLMAFLGLNTNDAVEVDIPLPSLGPAQPTAPVVPSVPKIDVSLNGKSNTNVSETPTTVLQHNTWPTQAECPSFYGSEHSIPGQLVRVQCPWVLHVDGGTLGSITIHQKCSASLARVLEYIWEQCGKDPAKIHAFGYDVFDGSYNDRPIAGTATLSMHAYGCALDMNAAANPQHAPLSATKFKSDSLIVFAFKQEGAIWGGDWSPGSIDAMHFQFARVR